MNKEKPILVTGGTGYIASWIIKYLLDLGYKVNTTVRSLQDEKKFVHLKNLDNGKLKFFEADLLKENSFSEAMKESEIVIHTASPFVVKNLKDVKKELIDPAKLGTRNVLNSVNKTPSVKKVILTSSVAAIHSDNKDIVLTKENKFTEEYWNFTSSETKNPYAYSKLLAEKEAWEIHEKQKSWELVVLNPSFVLGPSLSKRTDSTSVETMIQLGNGTFFLGVPEFFFGVVDVRDVAMAHIKAFEEKSSGRHILCSDSMELFEMGKILKSYYPKYLFPISKVPYFLMWLISPLIGFTREYVESNVGFKVIYDNSYTKKDLKMEFRKIEDTLKDHYEQLIKDKLI